MADAGPDLSGNRIPVVDDVPENLDVLGQVLEGAGYEMEFAVQRATSSGPRCRRDAPAIRSLASVAEWMILPGGEQRMRQGDPGDALYVVLNGRGHCKGRLSEVTASRPVEPGVLQTLSGFALQTAVAISHAQAQGDSGLKPQFEEALKRSGGREHEDPVL